MHSVLNIILSSNIIPAFHTSADYNSSNFYEFWYNIGASTYLYGAFEPKIWMINNVHIRAQQRKVKFNNRKEPVISVVRKMRNFETT